MAPLDATDVKRRIAQLGAPAQSNTATGKRLQDLAQTVIDATPGCAVVAANSLDVAKTVERDLWFTHDPNDSGLLLTDRLVPVECKNEQSRTGAPQVREFASKIKSSGGSDGILITRAGLAGEAGNSAHQAISTALNEGCRIVVITADDLAALTDTDQFVQLLNTRLTELRIKGTYVSI